MPRLLAFAVFLMAPVCFASGVLFTALGSQLRAGMPDAATTTGLLTLANTLGALAGSLIAAFLLLPALGLEKSFLALAALYVVIAIVIPGSAPTLWQRAAPVLAAAAALVLFPHGRMADTHYRSWSSISTAASWRRAKARRDRVLPRHDFLGEPWFYRLATNSYSMSATSMARSAHEAFAYLPAACIRASSARW